VAQFVSGAQFFENTGVSAYDGAIVHIEAAQLLIASATIATVEARHAAYLNLLNRGVPFPKAFDEPVAPRAICEAVQAERRVHSLGPDALRPLREPRRPVREAAEHRDALLGR
jgi:hypothetical protein